MGDPRRLRPDEVEIFVTRELRKAGIEVSRLEVTGRDRRDERGEEGFTIEMSGVMRVHDADRSVLVECRNQRDPVRPEDVEALAAKLAAAKADHGMMFSTSGYDPVAVRDARTRGLPLLTVADGKSAFARSPWGMAGQPPAWVPEYMSEVVDVDVTGKLRHHLVVADRPELILERLGAEADGQ
ncbi:MAG TPA: restriction endonuclease [Gemmatimonadaceae bacterium]|nr:restriction endonuclease [Gemmatimonadaceae bacterium]